MKFSSVQSLNHVQLSVTPWTAAHQAFLSITNSQSLLKLMSTESVMPSNHFILCCSLLLPPSILPSIRVFSNESVLRIRWPEYWSFSFSISPSNEYSGLISFKIDWLDLLCVQGNNTNHFIQLNAFNLSIHLWILGTIYMTAHKGHLIWGKVQFSSVAFQDKGDGLIQWRS